MERGAICRRRGPRAEEKVGDLCSNELVQNWTTWCHLLRAALETCGLLYSLSYLYTSCKPRARPQSCPDDQRQGRTWREMLTRDQEALFLRWRDLWEDASCFKRVRSVLSQESARTLLLRTLEDGITLNLPLLLPNRSKGAHCQLVHCLGCQGTYPRT